ncbi:MAG: hypothetical protein ABI647_25615 [Gemmatimonadota bacterium]
MFGLAATGLGVIVFLLVAEVVLRFLPVPSGPDVLEVNDGNPILHFVPNRSFTYSRGWSMRGVNRGRTNNVGWIADQAYDSTARTPLLAVIGDSFVEALMLPFAETLQGRMAKDVGSSGRVYGFAVSGIPLSQYLIEAQYAGSVFHPEGMAIVVVGNDFDESLLSYKVTPGSHSFAEGANGALTLSRTDFSRGFARKLLRLSALGRYLIISLSAQNTLANLRARGAKATAFVGNTSASADPKRLADSKRAVDAFLTELPGRSRLAPRAIAFVVDAVRPSIYSLEGAIEAAGSYFGLMRNYFMAEATRRGFEVVDLDPVFAARFARDHQRFEFPDDGHWNALGHEAAAQAIERSAVFRSVFPSVQEPGEPAR